MPVLSAMGNVWWDIDTGSAFTPFGGGGLGWAQLEDRDGDDDSAAAWRIGASVSYALGALFQFERITP